MRLKNISAILNFRIILHSYVERLYDNLQENGFSAVYRENS